MDELLYTQEDIDEWVRTCEKLQEQNRELKQKLDEKNLYEERQNSLINNLKNDILNLQKKLNKLQEKDERPHVVYLNGELQHY